jgi:hypothetical protein
LCLSILVSLDGVKLLLGLLLLPRELRLDLLSRFSRRLELILALLVSSAGVRSLIDRGYFLSRLLV